MIIWIPIVFIKFNISNLSLGCEVSDKFFIFNESKLNNVFFGLNISFFFIHDLFFQINLFFSVQECSLWNWISHVVVMSMSMVMLNSLHHCINRFWWLLHQLMIFLSIMNSCYSEANWFTHHFRMEIIGAIGWMIIIF